MIRIIKKKQQNKLCAKTGRKRSPQLEGHQACELSIQVNSRGVTKLWCSVSPLGGRCSAIINCCWKRILMEVVHSCEQSCKTSKSKRPIVFLYHESQYEMQSANTCKINLLLFIRLGINVTVRQSPNIVSLTVLHTRGFKIRKNQKILLMPTTQAYNLF